LEAVVGAIFGPVENPLTTQLLNLTPLPALEVLQGAFKLPGTGAAPAKGFYEAGVMEGIWAAAPYLHNGSVPTLAQLLKPAADRVASFNVEPA
jgi:hypothetical protein